MLGQICDLDADQVEADEPGEKAKQDGRTSLEVMSSKGMKILRAEAEGHKNNLSGQDLQELRLF